MHSAIIQMSCGQPLRCAIKVTISVAAASQGRARILRGRIGAPSARRAAIQAPAAKPSIRVKVAT